MNERFEKHCLLVRKTSIEISVAENSSLSYFPLGEFEVFGIITKTFFLMRKTES